METDSHSGSENQPVGERAAEIILAFCTVLCSLRCFDHIKTQLFIVINLQQKLSPAAKDRGQANSLLL